MKLQYDGQRLRVRINEDELQHLLDSQTINAATYMADLFESHSALKLIADDAARIEGTARNWLLYLPAEPVRALAARLPTREGIAFSVAADGKERTLHVLFDVDVRDSARRLKAMRARDE